MKTLKDIMILVFAATLIVSVTAYAEVADVLSADEAVTGKLKGEACIVGQMQMIGKTRCFTGWHWEIL